MRPSDADVATAVRRVTHRDVHEVTRSNSIYATSHRLEDVVVRLSGGEDLRLMCKHLGVPAMLPGAARAKPAFLYDPRRELEVYEHVLPPAGIGTATCYGWWSEGGRDWLLLEKVPGVELYQVGDIDRWAHAAAWLARAHRALAFGPAPPRLIRYDRAFYDHWVERSRGRGARHAEAAEAYGRVIDRLLAFPVQPIHGELYASNVLVTDDGRVAPVDWEMAAVGPVLVDLAALTTALTADQQERLERAYFDVRGWPDGLRGFLRDLDACRLHLCLRWLGWADDWQPPEEHAHDWLGEALILADRLHAGSR